ncbi:helix-turn-helix domain-containing protein [Chryseobacterium sp. L7]|uniref:Helix-turn-helix domain-containing protein n=1 Tax=Chryseobacterium endalhagicum TaxID=2797638 RepID=A0ABS1QG16_9FLAO|nr:helix-turn-helix domain-containing protein [Chryseobacterium endalhagicum]MBL1221540.1 helix-turn-helix domain-containing protein [Chryseobacterium endalhagicum]
METLQRPDYKKIYADLLNLKFPEKIPSCQSFLAKKELSVQDVIHINTIIFPKKTAKNQQHRSYDRRSILEMLDFQKKNRLNNTQLAIHFRLSRNTVAKWKKLFIV